jgi:hypothetical protein
MSRVDRSNFDRFQDQLRRNLPRGAIRAMRDYGAELVVAMANIAPRDTNRYVNAWLEAGEQAALSGIPARVPLVVSSHHARYVELLERQVEDYQRAWEAADARVEAIKGLLWSWYDSKGRKRDAFYNRKQRELRTALAQAVRARRRLDQTVAALAKAQPGIAYSFIYGRSARRGANGRRVSARLHRVLPIVYGGYGRMRTEKGKVILELVNLEAHANIVERNFNVLRDARRNVEGPRGLTSIRRGFKAVVIDTLK